MPKLVNLQNYKVKIFLSVISFLFAVLLLDWLIFSVLFLKIPNELEWDTSPWYNFLQKKETLDFKGNNNSILVTGSSVALYSYLPADVDETLKKSNLTTKSDFFAHVAMSPTDLYYYADEIISKKPSVVLYLINPGDLQMDHFPETNGSFDSFSETIRIHGYAQRHPVKFYYPLPFLFDNLNELKKIEILPLLTKSLLYVNRYRSFVYDPIDAYQERHFRSATSYHNYTGATLTPIQWRKGWTDKIFQVHCNLKNQEMFSERVFIPLENTEIKISAQSQELFKFSFPKSGWQNIEFPIQTKFTSETIPLNFEISKTVSSKDIDKKLYGKEYFYGIRLSQNFCKQEIERDISFTRIDSRDDQVLKEMSDKEYELDYFEKMYKDADLYLDEHNKIPARPEILRLYHLHKVKKYLNTKGPYRWSEFNFLEKAVSKFNNANIPIIIVNNPENPLELELYKNSDWYNDYLDFYTELSIKYSVKFYDKKDAVPQIQEFIDAHHLSYSGAKKMSEVYSEIIKENIR